MPAESLFDQALKAEGVSGKLADLARSIYTQESGGGKNSKTSNRGAVGGMQILPSTFRSVADDGWKIDDPMDNARGGIRYLKQLSKQAGGDPALVAAGYYGGPGGMAKAKQGIAVSDPKNPSAPNTLQYAAQVASRLDRGDTAASSASTSTPSPVAPAPVVVASAPQVQEAAAPTTVAVAQPAIAPVATAGAEATADPWQEFLRTMPQGQRAVTPEDFNYMAQPAVQAPVQIQMAQAPRSVRPNFEAFSGWTGRTV